jgi:hypothetical protein
MAESEQRDERSEKLEHLKDGLLADLLYVLRQYQELYVDWSSLAMMPSAQTMAPIRLIRAQSV